MSPVLDTSRSEVGTREDALHPSDASARGLWVTRFVLLVPGAVMLVLGLWRLGRDDAMGNDEVATRWVSSLPLHAMAHVLDHLDAVHGLYYLLIHFWSMAFGASPTALRVPSVIAMVLGTVVVGVLARRVTGSTLAGLAAGLVAACTPSISFYAQTARSYALVYLVVALCSLCLVRALDRERTSVAAYLHWAAYGLLVVFAGYLNELSLLVLAAHLVTVACARPGRAAAARWLAVSVTAVLAVLPLVGISRRQSMVLDYLRAPDGNDVRVLFQTMFGTTVVAVLLTAVALVGVVSRADAPRGTVSPATLGLPLLVVPPGLLMAYSEVARPIYADRYVLFGEIGVAVLAGAGLDRLVHAVPAPRDVLRVLAPAVVVLACAGVFAGQLGAQQQARTPTSRQFDFGGPAAYVGARARPGDGVLFFGLFYRKARLGYPADFRDTSDFAQAVSPEAQASFRGRNLPFAQVRPLILDHDRIWVIGRPPAQASDAVAGIRPEALVLLRHFERVKGARFGKVTATLWRRT